MAFIDDFADELRDTLTVAPFTGTRDRAGAPTYGADVVYNCRLVRKQKLVRSITGDQVMSSSNAVLKAAPVLKPTDNVTLSDSSTPEILAIENPQDETGDFAYTRIYFK